MLRNLAVLAFFATSLAGCATIREDQCVRTDWYELGVDDGRAGYAADRLTEHRSACARVKVEPDELQYLQGRKVGLTAYCQPENAFRQGLAGHEYHGACDAAYARNHRAAYDVATLRKSIDANRSAVSWREAELRGERASDDRRSNLRSEIRDLDRQREALRDRLFSAERELDRIRAVPLAPVAAVAPPPVAAKPPAPPPEPPVSVEGPGIATGSLWIGKLEAPLRFSYAFIAPDPFDPSRARPVLLLVGQAIPANVLGNAAKLQRVLDTLPYYVMALRNDAKPPRVTLVVRHPQLGATAVVDRDAARTGTARFEAYGSERIAGRIASPQNGKSAYAWSKALRMNVTFDAPQVRRWP